MISLLITAFILVGAVVLLFVFPIGALIALIALAVYRAYVRAKIDRIISSAGSSSEKGSRARKS